MRIWEDVLEIVLAKVSRAIEVITDILEKSKEVESVLWEGKEVITVKGQRQKNNPRIPFLRINSWEPFLVPSATLVRLQ